MGAPTSVWRASGHRRQLTHQPLTSLPGHYSERCTRQRSPHRRASVDDSSRSADRTAPISVTVVRSAAVTAANGFATGSSDQDAVRAGDLPHVAVGIGERAGVGVWASRLREVIVHRDGAPCLVP